MFSVTIYEHQQIPQQHMNAVRLTSTSYNLITYIYSRYIGISCDIVSRCLTVIAVMLLISISIHIYIPGV